MKKFILLLVFLFGLLLSSINISYSYGDTIIIPKEVNTNNLEEYLKDNNIDDIKEICSYDRCYLIKEYPISKTISNFKDMYDKYLSEEEYLEIKVKGYPITKIVIDK